MRGGRKLGTVCGEGWVLRVGEREAVGGVWCVVWKGPLWVTCMVWYGVQMVSCKIDSKNQVEL